MREIHDFRGVIESPNFPLNYPDDLHCEWTIVPPPGNKVFIEFSDFKMEEMYDSDDDEDGEADETGYDYLSIVILDEEQKENNRTTYRTSMPAPITTEHTVKLVYEIISVY